MALLTALPDIWAVPTRILVFFVFTFVTTAVGVALTPNPLYMDSFSFIPPITSTKFSGLSLTP